MKRRTFFVTAAMLPWLGACAGMEDWSQSIEARGIGMVVEYELAPDAVVKRGVSAVADSGYRLFGPASLNDRNGGTSHLGGVSIPRWVRVTWREGPGIEMDWKEGGWKGGTVAGDYTVPVLERIPREAFALARAGKKRVLVLRFRLRDDGVDFGWMVRLQDGVPFETLMHGGDL